MGDDDPLREYLATLRAGLRGERLGDGVVEEEGAP